MRVIRNYNLIIRNIAYRNVPGDVRAWDDGILFYPGDHVWLDHLSFSGMGRGSVVLSGTRITTSSTTFYTYRDCGWMTAMNLWTLRRRVEATKVRQGAGCSVRSKRVAGASGQGAPFDHSSASGAMSARGGLG